MHFLKIWGCILILTKADVTKWNRVDASAINTAFTFERWPQTTQIKSRTSRVQRWWSLSFFISINHMTLKSQEFLEWQQHCQAVSVSCLMRHSPSPVLLLESLHPWESCNLCLRNADNTRLSAAQNWDKPQRKHPGNYEGHAQRGQWAGKSCLLLELPAIIGYNSLFWRR